MPTYDKLSAHEQILAVEMADAAREVLKEFFKPVNDDRAAIFDEACAIMLQESKNEHVARLSPSFQIGIIRIS